MKKIQKLLTEAEVELATAAYTAVTGTISEANVTAQVYLAHRLREVTDDVIDSNANLANSNARYAKALNVLTACLVIVGVVQAVVIWRVSQS